MAFQASKTLLIVKRENQFELAKSGILFHRTWAAEK